jgi:Domain of unknown function (DUF4388)
MPLAGDLRQVALPEVLRTIERERRSGCLVISRGPLRAEVYFSQGQWLVVERVPVGPALAQQFVDLGFITPQQFEEVSGVRFLEAAIIPDADVAQLLVSTRLLTQEQLRFWALNDALALLNVVQTWPDGEFYFEDGTLVPPELVALPLAVGQILSWLQSEAALTAESVVNFTEVGPEEIGSIELSPDEWRLLTMVDGNMPLWAVAEALQAPEAAIVEVAQGLTSRGLIVQVGRVSAGTPTA